MTTDKRKNGRFNYFITVLTAAALLCQNIAWAVPELSGEKLAPQSVFTANQEIEQDKKSSGAFKNLGPALTEEKIAELEKKEPEWRKLIPTEIIEFPFMINKRGGQPGEKETVLIPVKFITVNDLPASVNAWSFREDKEDDESLLVIVSRHPPWAQCFEELVYHEDREHHWLNSGGQNRRNAHILACAEQVLAFYREGRINSYHKKQLESMSVEYLNTLMDEYDSGERDHLHYPLLEKHFSEGDIALIKEYEKFLRNRIVLLRLERQVESLARAHRWDNKTKKSALSAARELFEAGMLRRNNLNRVKALFAAIASKGEKRAKDVFGSIDTIARTVKEEDLSKNILDIDLLKTVTEKAGPNARGAYIDLWILAETVKENELSADIIAPRLLKAIAESAAEHTERAYTAYRNLVEIGTITKRNLDRAEVLMKKIAAIGGKQASEAFEIFKWQANVVKSGKIDKKVFDLELLITIVDRAGKRAESVYSSLIHLAKNVREQELNDIVLDIELLKTIAEKAGEGANKAYISLLVLAKTVKREQLSMNILAPALLKAIAESAGEYVEEAYDAYRNLVALNIITEDNLDRVEDLFNKIAAIGGWQAIEIYKELSLPIRLAAQNTVAGIGIELESLLSMVEGKSDTEVSFIRFDLALSVAGGLVAAVLAWLVFSPVGLTVLLANIPFNVWLTTIILIISLLSPWLTHEFFGHLFLGRILAKVFVKKYGYPAVRIHPHMFWTEIKTRQKPESLSEEQKTKVQQLKKVVAVLGPTANFIMFWTGLTLIFTVSNPLLLMCAVYISISNLIAQCISMIPVGKVPVPAISRWRRLSGRQSDGGIIFNQKILTGELLKKEISHRLRYDLEKDHFPSLRREDIFAEIKRDYPYLRSNWGRDLFSRALEELIDEGIIMRLSFSQRWILNEQVDILVERMKIIPLDPSITGISIAGTKYILAADKDNLIVDERIVEVFTYRTKKALTKDDVVGLVERVYFTKEGDEKTQKKKEKKKDIVVIDVAGRKLRFYGKLLNALGGLKGELRDVLVWCIRKNKMENFFAAVNSIIIINNLPQGLKRLFSNEAIAKKALLWSMVPESNRPQGDKQTNKLVDGLSLYEEFLFTVNDDIDFSLYWQFIEQLMENEPELAVLLFCVRFEQLLDIQIIGRQSQQSLVRNRHEEITRVFKPLFSKHFEVELSMAWLDRIFQAAFPAIYEKVKEKRDIYLREVKTELNKRFGCKGEGQLKNALKRMIIKGLDPGILRKINLVVTAREKGIWSLFDKTQRYDLGIDSIKDLLGFRVLVCDKPGADRLTEKEKIELCYKIMAIINEFGFLDYLENYSKDYIENPKRNGYQSLNTKWLCGEWSFEIQIKTAEMHEAAEKGAAKHSLYKQLSAKGDIFLPERTMVVAYQEVIAGRQINLLLRLPRDANLLDLLSIPQIDSVWRFGDDSKIIRRAPGLIQIKRVGFATVLSPGDIITVKLGERRREAVNPRHAENSKLYRSQLLTKTLQTEEEWREGLKMLLIEIKVLEKVLAAINDQKELYAGLLRGLGEIYEGYDFTKLARIANELMFFNAEELLTAVYYEILPVKSLLAELKVPVDGSLFEIEEDGETRSGPLKNIGPALTQAQIDKLKVKEAAWRKLIPAEATEYEIEINKRGGEPGEKQTVIIPVKFIRVTNIPSGVNAWYFRENKRKKNSQLIIVARKAPQNISYLPELIYHEARESHWANGGLHKRRNAHIIACAEQVLAFREEGKLTAYHEQQLLAMSIEGLTELIEEYRSSAREHHHTFYRSFFKGEECAVLFAYEELFYQRAMLIRNIKKAAARCSLSPAFKKKISQAMKYLPEGFNSRVRQIEGKRVFSRDIEKTLCTWFSLYFLGKALGVSVDTLKNRVDRGDIKSFVVFGGLMLFHPVKAMLEYMDFEAKRAAIAPVRANWSKIAKVLDSYSLAELRRLWEEIMSIVRTDGGGYFLHEGSQELRGRIKDILFDWWSLTKVAASVGSTYSTIDLRMSAGDIQSYVYVGKYRLLHPQKAAAEYQRYQENKNRIAARRLAETKLKQGLERLSVAELQALWQRVKEIVGNIEDSGQEAAEAGALREGLGEILADWDNVYQFAAAKLVTPEAIRARIATGDIRSFVALDKFILLHPQKARAEYSSYQAGKAKIRANRNICGKIAAALDSLSFNELENLWLKVTELEAITSGEDPDVEDEESLRAGLQDVLSKWYTIPQLAEDLGVGSLSIRLRIDAGDICSFIQIGDFTLLPKEKAGNEYKLYQANKSKIVASRLIETRVKKHLADCSSADLVALWKEVNAIEGVDKEMDLEDEGQAREALMEILINWCSVPMCAAELSINKVVIQRRIKSGDIKSCVQIGKHFLLHPEKAPAEYKVYQVNRDALKIKRNNEKAIMRALAGYGLSSLQALWAEIKQIGEIENDAEFNDKEGLVDAIKDTLLAWHTPRQVARELGLSFEGFRGRVLAGDIQSYVTVGTYKYYHPVKAAAEYRAYAVSTGRSKYRKGRADGDTEGALKNIGARLTEKQMTVLKKREAKWRRRVPQRTEEYPIEINLENGTEESEATLIFRGKIIVERHLYYCVDSWSFREAENDQGSPIVVVLRKTPKFTPHLSEMLFHEMREQYWLANGIKKQCVAHILTSAEQIIAFKRSGRLTAYHEEKLTEMNIDDLSYLIEEYRSRERENYHHKLYENFFTVAEVEELLAYERLFYQRAVRLRNIRQAVLRQKKTTRDQKTLTTSADKISDDAAAKVRAIEKSRLSTYLMPAILQNWFTLRMMAAALGVGVNTLKSRAAAGDISSFIEINSTIIFHPVKAMLEYLDYEDRKKEIKEERRLRTHIKKALTNLSAGKIRILVREVCSIDDDLGVKDFPGSLKDKKEKLTEILVGWQRIYRLARNLGVQQDSLLARVEAGDITSFVRVGNTVILHPGKAAAEYNDYLENRADIMAERMRRTTLLNALAALEHFGLERLMAAVVEIDPDTARNEQENLAAEVLRQNLFGILSGWQKTPQFAAAVGFSSNAINRMIQRNDIASFVVVGGSYYLHPQRALADYYSYQAEKDKLRAQRALRTKLMTELQGYNNEELMGLWQEISTLAEISEENNPEIDSEALKEKILEVLGQWPTAFQAAEIWGIGYDTVCERMSKGDIASYITIGIYRILHPQKALAEYNEYLARQSELMPMRLRETIIVEELERLALADLRPLWEKVKEITGAEEDEIIAAEDEAEQLRICLQRHLRSWLRVSAFAERLAAGTDAVFYRIRKNDITAYVRIAGLILLHPEKAKTEYIRSQQEKTTVMMERFRETVLRRGLAALAYTDLRNLFSAVLGIDAGIAENSQKDVSEGVLKDRLYEIISSWQTIPQFAPVVGLTDGAVHKIAQRRDIASYVEVGGIYYLHPEKALVDYRNYQAESKLLRAQRALVSKVMSELKKYDFTGLRDLWQKISLLAELPAEEDSSALSDEDLKKRIASVLIRWQTINQARKAWKLSYDAIAERITKGDIASCVTVGKYKFLHPKKAWAEYEESFSRQAELAAARALRNKIIRGLEQLTLSELRSLWEKVSEIEEAEETLVASKDEAKQLRSWLQKYLFSWLRVPAIAKKLGVSREAVLKQARNNHIKSCVKIDGVILLHPERAVADYHIYRQDRDRIVRETAARGRLSKALANQSLEELRASWQSVQDIMGLEDSAIALGQGELKEKLIQTLMRWETIPQTAKRLGITKQGLRRIFHNGYLKSYVKIGRLVYLYADKVIEEYQVYQAGRAQSAAASKGVLWWSYGLIKSFEIFVGSLVSPETDKGIVGEEIDKEWKDSIENWSAPILEEVVLISFFLAGDLLGAGWWVYLAARIIFVFWHAWQVRDEIMSAESVLQGLMNFIKTVFVPAMISVASLCAGGNIWNVLYIGLFAHIGANNLVTVLNLERKRWYKAVLGKDRKSRKAVDDEMEDDEIKESWKKYADTRVKPTLMRAGYSRGSAEELVNETMRSYVYADEDMLVLLRVVKDYFNDIYREALNPVIASPELFELLALQLVGETGGEIDSFRDTLTELVEMARHHKVQGGYFPSSERLFALTERAAENELNCEEVDNFSLLFRFIGLLMRKNILDEVSEWMIFYRVDQFIEYLKYDSYIGLKTMIRLAETEIMSRDNALAFMDIVRLLCTHHEIETYEITVILSSFMECARIIKDYLEAIPAQAVDDEDDFGVFYDILAFSGRDAGKVIDLIRYAHERLSLQLEDIIAFLVVSSETLGDSRFRVFINRLHDCIGAENEGHLMMLTNIRMMINEPELLRVFIGRTAETFKRGLAAEFSPENVAREFREEIFNDEFLNQRMVPAAPWCGDFVTEAAGTVRFMCEKGVIIPENVAAAKAWFTKLIEIYQQEARSVVNKLWYFMHVLPEELLSAQLLNLLCQLTNDNPGMFSDTMELLARISKTGMIKTAGDLFEYGSLLSMNDMVDAFRALDKRRLNMSITSKKLMIQKVKDALLGIDMLKYLSEHADCRQFMVAAAESKISNKEFVGLSCRINELRTTRLKRMNMSALDLVLLACRTSGISFRKTINTVHKNSDMFADMEEFAGVQALVRMQAGGKGSISPAEAKSTSNVLLFTSV